MYYNGARDSARSLLAKLRTSKSPLWLWQQNITVSWKADTDHCPLSWETDLSLGFCNYLWFFMVQIIIILGTKIPAESGTLPESQFPYLWNEDDITSAMVSSDLIWGPSNTLIRKHFYSWFASALTATSNNKFMYDISCILTDPFGILAILRYLKIWTAFDTDLFLATY